MIFSTHRLTSVVDMDEIIVISGGKAIERGSHAKLLAANGAYRRLWTIRATRRTMRSIRLATTATTRMMTRIERARAHPHTRRFRHRLRRRHVGNWHRRCLNKRLTDIYYPGNIVDSADPPPAA